MPRVTRAALRSQEMQEETDSAASVPLPLTPRPKGRAPLAETSGNTAGACDRINTPEETMATPKNGARKGKKRKTAKKATKQEKTELVTTTTEVVEEEDPSQMSPAAEEACNDLLEPDSYSAANQVAVDEGREHIPVSAAVNQARLQLSPPTTTPRSDPQQHPHLTITPGSKTKIKDSLSATMGSPKSANMTTRESAGVVTAEDGQMEDSFVEQIKTRTPGKRISRIEDSVEALDALEDEIEMVGGLIPSTNVGQTPIKTKKQTSPLLYPQAVRANGSVRVKRPTVEASKPKVTKPSPRPTTGTRPCVSRPPVQSLTEENISDHAPLGGVVNQKRDSKTGRPVGALFTLTESSEAFLKKRVSSIHKAPFQPAKSTKPPTRAAFELPGDAVARRLKEQREERLKREEEKKPEQHVFKARPVRLSHAPEVKLTAAAKARLSLAKGEPVKTTTTMNGGPKSKYIVGTGPVPPAGANKRLSTLSVAKRTSNPAAANSSTRLTRAPSHGGSATSRNASASGAPRPAPTAEDLANQKVKGKEVFGRTRVEIMEREKARRDKDEAVKKARAEAAERGRVASQKWAEKQRLRKMEAAEANKEATAVEA